MIHGSSALAEEAMQHTFVIRAHWDDEAEVWYVAETDVPGLATEAPTLDDLMRKLRTMVPELLELNGVIDTDHAAVPFALTAEHVGANAH
jgi:hypothetical protein